MQSVSFNFPRFSFPLISVCLVLCIVIAANAQTDDEFEDKVIFCPNYPATVKGINFGLKDSPESCDGSEKICKMVTQYLSVFPIATDPENDVMTFHYTVAAGKIVGIGSEVTWDLTSAGIGTYSITICADDGVGCIPSNTRTFQIEIVSSYQDSTIGVAPVVEVPRSDPHGFLLIVPMGKGTLRTSAAGSHPVVNFFDADLKSVAACRFECNSKAKVKLTVDAFDIESDVLTFEYEVDEGEILGIGRNVTWDLSGVSPGEYTVTVCANDGTERQTQANCSSLTVKVL